MPTISNHCNAHFKYIQFFCQLYLIKGAGSRKLKMCPEKVSRERGEKTTAGKNSECWLPVPAPLLTHHVTPTNLFPSLTYWSSVKPSNSQQHSSTSISLLPWFIGLLHPLGDPNIMLPHLFPHFQLHQTQILMWVQSLGGLWVEGWRGDSREFCSAQNTWLLPCDL